MKRAAAPHHPALADQFDPASHQLDQIDPPPDFFQQSFAIAHGAIRGANARELGAQGCDSCESALREPQTPPFSELFGEMERGDSQPLTEIEFVRIRALGAGIQAEGLAALPAGVVFHPGQQRFAKSL